MFLFKSLASKQSLTFFFPSGVSFTLQTVELTQSVGSVTSVMMSSARTSSPAQPCTVVGCELELYVGVNNRCRIVYKLNVIFVLGNRPILSKQSWYSVSTVVLDRLPWKACSAVACGCTLENS